MSKTITKSASPEAVQSLRNSFPIEEGFTHTVLPRLDFKAQDVVEGKGKSMKVVIEAGTFLLQTQTNEKDENGKKIWASEEIGKVIEGVILYQRKQLKFYDVDKYISSSVYDNDDEIVTLFKDKAKIDFGTPKELKARPAYQGKSAKGKDISKLEDNRILYVLYEDKVYQLNVRGTSFYAFKAYAREVTPTVPAVLTEFSSEAKENGAISWSQIKFEKVRDLNADEIADVQNRMDEIRSSIAEEKAYYASLKDQPKKKDELDEVVSSASNLLE